MEEIWKDITGYEGLYQVSNLGRIKSIGRLIKNGWRGQSLTKDKILSIQKQPNGYCGISLNNGIKKRYIVHRFVALAFLPNPNNHPQINHIDGNKTNNRIENLEWCTGSENAIHAFKTSLRVPPRAMLGKFGVLHPLSKKVLQTDKKTGEIIREFNGVMEASRITGIGFKHISRSAKSTLNAGGFKWVYP